MTVTFKIESVLVKPYYTFHNVLFMHRFDNKLLLKKKLSASLNHKTKKQG